MTRTSPTCELWLVLKCYLIGFCNLMYYKSNATFTDSFFLDDFTIAWTQTKSKTGKSWNRKISHFSFLTFVVNLWSMHWLCKSNWSFVHKVSYVLFVTLSSCVLLLKLFLIYNIHVPWDNFTSQISLLY